jgi:YVTN family beta-propeller protein
MPRVGLRRFASTLCLSTALSACPPPPAATTTGVFSKLPSKSGTVALSEDEKLVVLVNTDDDSISVFDAATNARKAVLKVGDEPAAVVIAADNKTAYVANRASASVMKITGIDTDAPTVAGTLNVGSEPLALALTPSGNTLFVAEWAEGRVAAIETAGMTEAYFTDAPRNPRALAVTNNGDQNDADELVIMPEFFGEAVGTEATNESREGIVRVYNVSNLTPNPNPFIFKPVSTGFNDGAFPAAAAITGSEPIRGTGNPVKAGPNQLGSVAIANGKIYVTSIAAAPAGKPQFNNNVYPIVLVGKLDGRTVDEANTFNILDKIVAGTDLGTFTPTNGAKRLAMGDIVDIAFVANRENVAYVVSRAADGVQRVTFSDSGPTIGSTQSFQIDVSGTGGVAGGCKNPTGIAVKGDGTKAFLNCWVSKRLGVIDLTSQTLADAVESAPSPAAGTNDFKVQDGKRFYFTGRGRWSKGGEGWSSCGSCHPDGLTDNITWVFGAGPRQTVSQDGSFSHGAQAGKRRVFNFTALFDEHHDFERNVRNVSGGIGVITKPKAGKTNADCGNIANEDPIPLTIDAAGGAGIDGLGKPLKVHNDTPVGDIGCKLKDWDEVDEFVKTIRPVGKLRKVDQAQVDAGRTLFTTNGGCAKCHGGAGWTQSRRFYEPSESRNTALATEVFTKPAAWPANFSQHSGATQITIEPGGPGPREVSCVIRNTETFGSAELEKNENGTTAVGAKGYNIPSLYGLAVGAPYLHHGGAKTLDALLSEAAWQKHTEAGAGNFAPNATERAQLIAFLLSIDATTTEIDPPANFDGCPAN